MELWEGVEQPEESGLQEVVRLESEEPAEIRKEVKEKLGMVVVVVVV